MKKYILSILATVLALALNLPTITAQYDDMYNDPAVDDRYTEYEEEYFEDAEEEYADTDYYYYDNDYDESYYSNQIRRFRRSNVNLNYYDPFYTSFYSPILVPRTSLFVTVGYRPLGYSNFYNYLAWQDYNRYSNGYGNYYFPTAGYGNPFGGRYGGGVFGAGAGAYNPYCPPGSYSTGSFITANTPVQANNNRRTYTSSARTRVNPATRTTTSTRAASPASRTNKTYTNPRSGGNTRAGVPATRTAPRATTRTKSTGAKSAPRTRSTTSPRGTKTSTAPKRTYSPKRSGSSSVRSSGSTARPSVIRSTSSGTKTSSTTRSSSTRKGNN